METNPLVSLFILTYNQEKYVKETIQSALKQTYNPLEIIISDDCSQDKTYEIVQDIIIQYSGPKKIIPNRNQTNLGIASNMNRAWELSKGEFIVAGSGDDVYLSDRVEKLINRLKDSESPVDLAVSYFAEIDEKGNRTGFVKKEVVFVPDKALNVNKWKCGATGACASYSRKLYDKYGPLDPNVLAEDWVFSFRAWLEDGIAVIEEPLVLHRTHDNSISIIQRDIKKIKDKKEKLFRRKQGEQSRLAIAKEWLKAWTLSCDKDEKNIKTKLKCLVNLREIQCQAFESSRYQAIKLALSLLKKGYLINAMKLIVRHVICL